MKEIIAADPFEERLKPISMDKGCKGNYPAWILRSFGDPATYKPANANHTEMQYGIVVVKSTVWPGAMSYFWRGQWGDIYVGNGHKHEDVTYFPVNPPMIQDDPDEKGDQPEPNPNDAIYQDNERTKKINAIVDEIWAKYDADGNGALDKEETWKLA